jgi:hypothetical protein
MVLGALFISGCATYAPPKVDEKTGMYKASASLDGGAVEKRDTNVDLKKFRFVYLVTQSNVYPGRFEFFARSALAHAGFTNVLNTQELTEFITETPALSSITSVGDLVSRRRLAQLIGPIMFVQVSSMWDGNVRRDVTLTVVDLSSGKTLLQIDHNKLIWADVDSEAHYPVLNEFNKWVKECGTTKERT